MATSSIGRPVVLDMEMAEKIAAAMERPVQWATCEGEPPEISREPIDFSKFKDPDSYGRG